jgi:hypothetical protein
MTQECAALKMLSGFPKPKSRRRSRKLSTWRKCLNFVLAWVNSRKLSGKEKRLRLRETISFGEKRFAAVVEFEGHSFLIGGTASSICLLSDLARHSFAATLTDRSNATGN